MLVDENLPKEWQTNLNNEYRDMIGKMKWPIETLRR